MDQRPGFRDKSFRPGIDPETQTLFIPSGPKHPGVDRQGNERSCKTRTMPFCTSTAPPKIIAQFAKEWAVYSNGKRIDRKIAAA